MRSQYHCVVSRSPVILQIMHWSNYSEIVFTMVIALSNFIRLPKNSALVYWTLEGMMNVSHCLMIFSYTVRAYRLLFVFDVHKDQVSFNFSLDKRRATQRWNVKLLAVLIFPVIVVYVVILLILVLDENAVKLYDKNEYGKRTQLHYMISTFIEFSLQLLMIMTMYRIRAIENKFQMTREMMVVTVVLSITPIFSIFVSFERLWMFAYIFRNFFIMLTSSMLPIVLSFVSVETIDFISIDMLGSLRVILENKLSLDVFESFLKNSNFREGLAFLEIYLNCECYSTLETKKIAMNIIDKVRGMEMDFSCECPEDPFRCNSDSFKGLHDYCFYQLEVDYFPLFVKSNEFQMLKILISRQEAYINRISETSLQRSGSNKGINIKLVSLGDSR